MKKKGTHRDRENLQPAPRNRRRRADARGRRGPDRGDLKQETRRLDLIRIGDRARRDMGDIDGLAASIDEVGLLQPIVITPKDELIAGGRRMLAWRRSRFCAEPIPVHVVDIDAIVRGEWAENAWRKDLTPSEAVAIKRLLEPKLKEAAKERQRAHGGTAPGRASRRAARAPQHAESGIGSGTTAPSGSDGAAARNSGERKGPSHGSGGHPETRSLIPDSKHSGQFARSDGAAGRAADQVARITGKTRRTLEKAEAVVAAAEKDPKRFGKLKEDMDRTGRVDGPFKRLQMKQQAEKLRKTPPPLPMQGPYRCLVIDFPWPHEPDMEQDELDERGRSLRPYPAMSIKAGCHFFAEHVAPVLAPDCVVWMWTTNFHMPYAFHLLQALGFRRHSTIGTWPKSRMGRGQVLRDKTEHCIVARRGKPLIHLTNETTDWSGWKQRENSRKPDEFYAMVERLCPAPRYAELFSRGGRNERWDCHGDQVGKFAVDDVRAAMTEMIAETTDVRPRFKQNPEPAAADGLDIPTFLRRSRDAQTAADEVPDKHRRGAAA